MPRCVVFLRAINVGGRVVTMAALARHFHELGYADAQTYINSGNVIFRIAQRSESALAAAIGRELSPRLGFETHAFVRVEARVLAIAERAMAMAGDERLADVNVAFFGAPLGAAQVSALDALRSESDDFEADGCELYWKSRLRQSQSKVSNAALERRLKVRTTLRRAVMLHGLAQQLQALARC